MAEIVKPGVLFKKGLIGNLKPLMASGGKEGTFYLAEDERNLYFGTASGKIERIQGNVIFWGTLSDFKNNTPPPYSTDLIHFIADNNALVRWNGSKWVQLNATADSVNEAFTNVTAAIEALEESVGANAENIGKNTAAIEQNKKDIATKAAQADHEALEGRVTKAEGTIATHTSQIATKAEQEALDATNEAVAQNAADIEALEGVVATKAAQADLTALTKRVTDAEGTIEDHGELIATKAAQSDLNDLTTRVDAAEDAIEANATAIRNNLATFNNYKTANDARVEAVEVRVGKNESAITKLQSDKADLIDFNALSDRVDTVSDAVNTNATNIGVNGQAIQALQNTVATKADNTEFQKVATRVTEAEADIVKAQSDI
jgi:predicted  nucleic acid-binding Zn-ribbon protein